MENKKLKIGLHPTQITRDLGSGIFEISIHYPEKIFEQKLREYADSQHKNKKNQEALEDFLARNRIEAPPAEAVQYNLQHIFQADTYFTNGQRIVSCFERNGHFELLEHSSKAFTHFHLTSSAFFRLSIHTLQPIEAISERNRDLEVVKLLKDRQVQFLPILESNEEWAMMSHSLLEGYEFRYAGKVLKKQESFYEGQGLDKILKEFIALIRPATLKCCLNCAHFKFSGMSHQMSSGTVGYCGLLLDNPDNREGVQDSVTGIDAWCDDFRGAAFKPRQGM
jgi:hypothetical protein